MIKKNFNFLFLFFFKKYNIYIYNSYLVKNNIYIYIPISNYINNFLIFLKKDIFFSNYFLIENSGYNSVLNINNIFSFFIYLNKYSYTNNLILFTLINNFYTYNSLSLYFKGLNWTEREFLEMFNIFIKNQNDTRKLLLDYSFNSYYGPLNKKYILTDNINYNIFYNITNNNLININVYNYIH